MRHALFLQKSIFIFAFKRNIFNIQQQRLDSKKIFLEYNNNKIYNSLLTESRAPFELFIKNVLSKKLERIKLYGKVWITFLN